MSKLRILCAADLHLGRSSAAGLVPADVDLTTISAWLRVVDLAIVEEADAVAIAGDLFDGVGSYLESRRKFIDGLRLLELNQIPVVAVSGNHDWNVLPIVARQAPSNFYLLGKGGNWERLEIETKSGPVQFVGWSFPSEQVNSSQFASLEVRDWDGLKVGIVHGDIATESPYHPISPRELEGNVDAWVLGHVHKPSRVSETAIYPGSPQSLDFGPGERGVHGVNWLTYERGRCQFSETVPISNARFECLKLEVDAQGERAGVDLAIDRLQNLCLEIGRQCTANESIHLRANVTLKGDRQEANFVEAGAIPYLDRHSIEIVSIQRLKVIDPWSLKDLRDVTGEAARLLIGANALTEEVISGPEIPENWIEDARRLIDQSAKDIEFQFQRTLATVSDNGEAGIGLLSEDEIFEKAHMLLVEELQQILQESVS